MIPAQASGNLMQERMPSSLKSMVSLLRFEPKNLKVAKWVTVLTGI